MQKMRFFCSNCKLGKICVRCNKSQNSGVVPITFFFSARSKQYAKAHKNYVFRTQLAETSYTTQFENLSLKNVCSKTIGGCKNKSPENKNVFLIRNRKCFAEMQEHEKVVRLFFLWETFLVNVSTSCIGMCVFLIFFGIEFFCFAIQKLLIRSKQIDGGTNLVWRNKFSHVLLAIFGPKVPIQTNFIGKSFRFRTKFLFAGLGFNKNLLLDVANKRLGNFLFKLGTKTAITVKF